MPKYWGKQIFSLGSFPEVSQKKKTEKNKKTEHVGNNNGQLLIANATSGGARKPPGPKFCLPHVMFVAATHLSEVALAWSQTN